jgi:hypothetical protein
LCFVSSFGSNSSCLSLNSCFLTIDSYIPFRYLLACGSRPSRCL